LNNVIHPYRILILREKHMSNPSGLTWQEYIKINNLNFSMLCTVPSGKIQYTSGVCTITASTNIGNKLRIISQHPNCDDEDLRIKDENNKVLNSGVDRLHTELLHPYVYIAQSWLFANIGLHHSAGNEWYLYHDFFNIYSEAFVQGMQSVIFRDREELELTNLRFSLFGQYSWPAKSKINSVPDYFVTEFLIRLARYTNPLSYEDKVLVTRAFLTGWHLGIVLKAETSLYEDFFFIKRAIRKVYQQGSHDNGYEQELFPDQRQYHITHSMLSRCVHSDLESLDRSEILKALKEGINNCRKTIDIFQDIIIEGNKIAKHGQCQVRD
jgi:hypothetical protein